MLNSLSSNVNRTAFDVVNLIAGLGLLVSPWLLGYAAETSAAWNAWLTGAAVAVIAIVALVAYHQAEQWANLALGLWAIVAPWALGFAGVSAALTAHLVAGPVIAVVAAASLWFVNQRPLSRA